MPIRSSAKIRRKYRIRYLSGSCPIIAEEAWGAESKRPISDFVPAFPQSAERAPNLLLSRKPKMNPDALEKHV